MITRTTTALLDDLVDPGNEQVWTEFDDRFRPVLMAMGRRLGLHAEDAADAAQEALTRFVTGYRAGKYDRSRGRLRSWLSGIARHCIIDLIDRQVGRREQAGISQVAELPDEPAADALFGAECEQEILRQAMDELRRESNAEERTIRAFELIALGGRRPADVAVELDMTPNDVYLAKHRCLRQLRAIVARLDDVYEIK